MLPSSLETLGAGPKFESCKPVSLVELLTQCLATYHCTTDITCKKEIISEFISVIRYRAVTKICFSGMNLGNVIIWFCHFASLLIGFGQVQGRVARAWNLILEFSELAPPPAWSAQERIFLMTVGKDEPVIWKLQSLKEIAIAILKSARNMFFKCPIADTVFSFIIK